MIWFYLVMGGLAAFAVFALCMSAISASRVRQTIHDWESDRVLANQIAFEHYLDSRPRVLASEIKSGAVLAKDIKADPSNGS